jgi:hypothetical protein
MTELIPVTYIEADTVYCGETYGTGNCTAAVGVTGSQKCFNTRNYTCDCQDPDNFAPTTKTVRFGVDNGYLPLDIDCIPAISKESDIRVQNASVKPGESIGERSTININFKDLQHSDNGFDLYVSERTYDPFTTGSFWGKFFARNSYLHERPLRLIRGSVGQALNEMETTHFVIDKITGPNEGKVSIKGVDFMRLLNAETAQAPAASKGYLSVDYSSSTTALTLGPTGIGSGSEYPASGKVAIGKHIYDFTKSGDVLTVTPGLIEDQKADDVAQLVLEYSAQTVDLIIADLIENYSPLTSSHIPSVDWAATIANYSDTLYTAEIAKPIATIKLINELVELAGLILHGDTKTKTIKLDVMRPVATTQGLLDESKLTSFKYGNQLNKRYSQIYVNYNQIDPLKRLDEPGSFAATVVALVDDNQFENERIKKINARWIPQNGRSIAEAVAERGKARYKIPPRKFVFSLFAGATQYTPGDYVSLSHHEIQVCTGEAQTVPAVITGVQSANDAFSYEAEEITFDGEQLSGIRYIQIDDVQENINFRDIYDTLYATVDASMTVTVIIGEGVAVGSTTVADYGARTGTWPTGLTLNIVNNGFILGKGGDGAEQNENGGDGGDALLVEHAIEIDNTNGVIGGGGGGGGSVEYSPGPGVGLLGRGGGGAGHEGGLGAGYYYISGSGGPVEASEAGYETGQDGTQFTGTVMAGDGGDLGQPGANGAGTVSTNGGAAGNAVDGDSLVTWVSGSLANVYGARVN